MNNIIWIIFSLFYNSIYDNKMRWIATQSNNNTHRENVIHFFLLKFFLSFVNNLSTFRRYCNYYLYIYSRFVCLFDFWMSENFSRDFFFHPRKKPFFSEFFRKLCETLWNFSEKMVRHSFCFILSRIVIIFCFYSYDLYSFVFFFSSFS